MRPASLKVLRLAAAVLKKKMATVALGSIVTAGVLGLATPAQASTSQCGRGYACMWHDTTYGGSYYGIQYSVSFTAAVSSFNDETSSIMNNGYSGNLSKAYFYDAGNFQGDNRVLYDPAAGRQYLDPYLGNGTDANNAPFNDVISSASFGN